MGFCCFDELQQVLQWVFKETNEKDGQRTSHSTKKKGTSLGKRKMHSTCLIKCQSGSDLFQVS